MRRNEFLKSNEISLPRFHIYSSKKIQYLRLPIAEEFKYLIEL